MYNQIDLNAMTTAMAATADTARAIGTNKHQSQSQFAVPLRAALSHAQDLLDQHAAWLAANPAPVPAAEPPAEPQA